MLFVKRIGAHMLPALTEESAPPLCQTDAHQCPCCSLKGCRAKHACRAVNPAWTNAVALYVDREATGCRRFTQSRCQHEQQPCPVKEAAGHCGYECRMQRFTVLHGSLLHAWGPILSVAALSGVSNARKGRRKRAAAAGDGGIDEIMEGEAIDEAGIADEDGTMRADVEELMDLANCDAASQDAQCGPPHTTPVLHRRRDSPQLRGVSIAWRR